MSCIVGVIDKGELWMGADSAASSNYEMHIRPDQKMFRRGPMLIGFAGSFRVGQLMQYSFTMPVHQPELTNVDYFVSQFVPAFRTCCDAGGVLHPGDRDVTPTSFLIGYRGQLYQLEENFQIGQSAHKHDAIGCANHFALGSLWTSRGLDARARVCRALEAAEHYSTAVAKPFKIICHRERGRIR